MRRLDISFLLRRFCRQGEDCDSRPRGRGMNASLPEIRRTHRTRAPSDETCHRIQDAICQIAPSYNGSLQTICHCGFTERQAEITVGWRSIKVEFMAEPLRIATR